MSTRKFDPDQFFASPQSVAALVTDEEVFGMLTRSIELPPGVAALVTQQQGDHQVCAAGGTVSSENASELLLVRTTPLVLEWVQQRVTSSDKFQADVSVTLTVGVHAERSDLLSFRKRIIGSLRRVDVAGLVNHLRPPIDRALITAAGQHAMKALADGTHVEEVTRAVTEAAAGPCFEAGLSLEDSPQVVFDSPTLRQVRRSEEQAVRRHREHAAQRQLQQAMETAQGEHLKHLEGLLGKLQKLADESPDVGLPELVRTFSESQRGEIYDALFAATADVAATRWIVVAAGTELLLYDPDGADAPARRISLDGAVGPVRSVQVIRDEQGTLRVLAGAARGVYEVGTDDEAAVTTFAFADDVTVRGGVNSVAAAGDRILASHSEVGLVSWMRGAENEPQHLLSGLTAEAQAVRGVQFYKGRIYCSVDKDVIAFAADDPAESNVRVFRGSDSFITAICPADAGLYAGNADGQVLCWSHEGDGGVRTVHSGNRRPAESLHLLTVGGVSRLVFTDTSLAVHARVIGDTFACRYEAGGQTLRRVEAAADVIAATNEIRDRLLLFKPHKPTAPFSTISVARQTGRSIQDVCLLPTA